MTLYRLEGLEAESSVLLTGHVSMVIRQSIAHENMQGFRDGWVHGALLSKTVLILCFEKSRLEEPLN